MRSLTIILLILLSGKLLCQDAFQELDQVYGLDPLLYNGKKYSYFLPKGTGGTQFLFSDEFVTGEVTIRGRKFEGVSLNYDIYNQQLLLKYLDETGAFNIIEISKAWLEGFRLGTPGFRCINSGKDARIYQVLGKGPYFIYYAWRKDLKLDANSGAKTFIFTPAVNQKYVMIDGNLRPFSSKGSLVSIFGPEHKQEIKNYMREKRIKLKRSSDDTMAEFINFISNL